MGVNSRIARPGARRLAPLCSGTPPLLAPPRRPFPATPGRSRPSFPGNFAKNYNLEDRFRRIGMQYRRRFRSVLGRGEKVTTSSAVRDITGNCRGQWGPVRCRDGGEQSRSIKTNYNICCMLHDGAQWNLISFPEPERSLSASPTHRLLRGRKVNGGQSLGHVRPINYIVNKCNKYCGEYVPFRAIREWNDSEEATCALPPGRSPVRAGAVGDSSAAPPPSGHFSPDGLSRKIPSPDSRWVCTLSPPSGSWSADQVPKQMPI